MDDMKDSELNRLRWEMVMHRTSGAFVYGVVTTGVYCRPECPSRRARREHVRFFETGEDAVAAGFRPCLRCRPGMPARHAAVVRQACEWMASRARMPGLTDVARRAGMSPHHFQRVFKAVVGLTPGQYARAVRDRRMRTTLGASASVTEAFHAAGFGSSGRFYQEARHRFGMAPGRYRSGGAGETIHYVVRECLLGYALVAATAVGVCAVFLGDAPETLAAQLTRQFPRATLRQASPEMAGVLQKAIDAINSPRLGADLPMDIRGTVFQQRVWEALRRIPPGETRTYRAVAEVIGHPTAARAVARACAANPLAVLVPCHRVCRADGTAGGFRWGLSRKRALLDREP